MRGFSIKPVVLSVFLLILTTTLLFAQELNQPRLSVFNDQSGELTMHDILQQPDKIKFEAYNTSAVNLGRGTNVHWLAFSAQLDTQSCIMVEKILGGTTQLFVINPERSESTEVQRTINPIPIYCLTKTLNKPTSQQFYLRITHPREMLRVVISTGEKDQLFSQFYQKTTLLTLLAGSLIIIGIYHFILLINLRELTYISVIGFALVFGMQAVAHYVPISKHFSDVFTFWQPALVLLAMLASGIFVRITTHFHQLPWYGKPLVDIALLGLIILMPISLYYPDACFIAYMAALLVHIPFTGLYFYTVAQGSTVARSALIANLIFTPTLVSWLLVQVQLIDAYPYYDIIFYFGLTTSLAIIAAMEVNRTREIYEEATKNKVINKAKDQFLATMSHELRTPIHTVMGTSELLMHSELSNQQASYIQQLNTAAKHVLDMIDEVLDFARIDYLQDHADLESEPFQLQEIVEQCEGLFTPPATLKQLDFQINLEGNKELYLLGDRKRLMQILINLVGNAIKFTDTGSVTLSITAKTTLQSPQTCQLSITVKDTGIGISREQQRYLFDAFYQVEPKRTRQHKGTGLGLTISAQLVEYMGGHLKVISQPQQGSQFAFKITLPLADKQPTHKKNAESPLCIKGSKILIVDDDLINASLAEAFLSSQGASVKQAHSGADAIHCVKQQDFDLIFMDISMPKMDGYEAVKQLRKLPSGKTLTIIALTAHAIEGEKERCLAAGMDDYLTKPFSLNDIVNKVYQWK